LVHLVSVLVDNCKTVLTSNALIMVGDIVFNCDHDHNGWSNRPESLINKGSNHALNLLTSWSL